jgi:hypothetical protein
MMSAFVWLDYSERERRKMLDVVDLFIEHDTRDELGIGSVRDAFDDTLPRHEHDHDPRAVLPSRPLDLSETVKVARQISRK